MDILLEKGGFVMGLLLVCSMLAGAVFIERLSYYHRIAIRTGEFLRGVILLVRSGRFAEAERECAGTPGPVARVVLAAVLRPESSRAELKEIVQETGQLEVPRLERRLPILAAIAYVTPVLGLLGTVLGLIQAFMHVSSPSGFSNSTQIADGIYASLLNTAAGLMVCIPAAVGYGYLSCLVNTLLHDMERAGIDIVNALSDLQVRIPSVLEFLPANRVSGRSAVE